MNCMIIFRLRKDKRKLQRTFSTRIFQRTMWVSVVVIAAFTSNGLGAGPKPNIILMIADDLGYGDLGCYGNTSVNTPNIDSLAHDGVKLTQHLTAASVCTPSRAAFLTGRYPIRSGMAPRGILRVKTWIASSCGLPPSAITFAELTRQAGYRNGFIGKWHIGLSNNKYGDHLSHPVNQGFDHYYGLTGTNLEEFDPEGQKVVINYRPYWYWELIAVFSVTALSLTCLYAQGYIKRPTLIAVLLLWLIPHLLTWQLMDNMTLLSSVLHRNHEVVEQPIRLAGLHQRFVKEGIEFLNNATSEQKPFLLVMSWSHMHTFLKTHTNFAGKTKFGRYGDALEELDWSVGEILKYVDASGLRDNTLVYFTSDNGAHMELGVEGGSNGILKGSKGHGAPDGGIRVAGLLRWPGVITAGKVIDEPTSLMDLYPTIADIVGVNVPTDRYIDGRNILPLIKEETAVSPHEFMFHYCGEFIHGVRYRPRSGRTTWKLVTHIPRLEPGKLVCPFICSCNTALKLETPQLYDMTSDPGETSPVDWLSEGKLDLVNLMLKAISDHSVTVGNIDSQFTWRKLVWRPDLQPCCGGTFPFCYCKDEKYPE